MTTQQEQVKLSPCEREVWDQIRRKLTMAGKASFNADDLHYWIMNDGTPLDKVLYGADSQKMGLYIEKLCLLGLIRKVLPNQVLGRYNRYIWNYRVVQK